MVTISTNGNHSNGIFNKMSSPLRRSPSNGDGPTRTRSSGSSGNSSNRGRYSCFKIILALISLQMLGVFLVAITMGSSWHDYHYYNDDAILGLVSNKGDYADAAEIDDETRLQREEEIARLDAADPREGRVLYQHPQQQPVVNTADSNPDEGATDATEEEGGEEGESDTAMMAAAVAASAGLDNYGERRHIPKNTTAPYLIVGGSDGSGTRAMVDTLVALGAFFYVEDRRTMDVHGGEMFKKAGWPPVVNLVLNYTHSANYEVKDLPDDIRERALSELKKLKKGIDTKAKGKMRRLDLSTKATATHVGWKAPVAMMLLPLLREVFGPIKFLHVVRDGRDVALSDNQSPVKKFYHTYYGLPGDGKDLYGEAGSKNHDKNMTIYAMQLWNDWNKQVMEWGKAHSDGVTFDYLTMRTEDVVNPETKLNSLLQLADFVGSKKSLKDLCCMSQTELKDMGKSSGSFNDAAHTHRRRGPPPRPGSKADFMKLGTTKEDFVDEILHGPKTSHQERMDALLRRRKQRQNELLQNANAAEERRRHEPQLNQLNRHNHTGTHKAHMHVHTVTAREKVHKSTAMHNPSNGKVDRIVHRDHHQHAAGHAKINPPATLKEKQQQGETQRRLLEIGGNNKAKLGGSSSLRQQRRPAARHTFQKEAPDKVKARYGKWVKLLEDQPELSATLHKMGESSLELFGYEPPATFLDPPSEFFVEQCERVLEDKLCKQ